MGEQPVEFCADRVAVKLTKGNDGFQAHLGVDHLVVEKLENSFVRVVDDVVVAA